MTTTTADTLTRLPAQTTEADQMADCRWDIDWLLIVGLLGYYVVQWPLATGARYLLLAALTYRLSFAIYDLVVRRTNLTRFLFGMKPRPTGDRTLARDA